jgi:hypothetical protein
MDAKDQALVMGRKRPPHDSQLVALLEQRYSPLARAAVLREVKTPPQPRRRPRGPVVAAR